jgi:mannose/fructose/N-acetylgalactosamine-specific phosphotransferase system component IIB
VEEMCRLVERVPAIRAVNLGGVHQGPGRTQRLRYLYLSADEERALLALESRGVTVSAQDVPTGSPVPLHDLLAARGSA